jgi:hypothetical protein
MTVEVVQESVRIFANVTEVDALTSTLKQQESVEVFEKRRVRLVNGAQNGLIKSQCNPRRRKFTKRT